jgi:XTP/dITP diphosphohydrolase
MSPERHDDSQVRPPRLVLATANPHKLTELTRILEADSVAAAPAGLSEFPGAPDVAETGATFAENALLKARAVARYTGLPAVADDSGLCVDALGGMPGVLSARWSGGHGDDEANLRLVLAQIADVPDERRGAHFACAAALVLPSGEEHVSEGTVHGTLIRHPRGTGGFGYDPIFVPDRAELGEAAGLAGLTTAEMPPEAKDAISHRGRALRALAPAIAAALGRGVPGTGPFS